MKHNKGFGLIGILGALAVVAVISGVVYKASKKDVPVQQKSMTNSFLYKGEDFIVNTMYPSSYITLINSSVLSPNTKQISFNDGDCLHSECSTQVEVYIKDGLVNKEALYALVKARFLNDPGIKGLSFKVTTTNITVDNEAAIQYSYQQYAGGYTGTTYITVIFHNGKGYIIQHVNSTVPQYIAFVSSFKFTVPSEFTNTTGENSPQEVLSSQPGAIKSITVKDNGQWILAVDLLSSNPKWLPGVDSTGGFFINQNSKIRNLIVTQDTKTYDCGPGPDNNDTSADVLEVTSSFVSKIQADINTGNYAIKGQYDGPVRYMDINGSTITAIYTQCLP